MLEAFEQGLKDHQMLRENDAVVLGISGGPDSMAMADLFVRIRERWQLKLHVVHVNHQLRGPLADADADYVAAFCERHQIAFHLVEAPVAHIAREKGQSLEEAGRHVRYEAFWKVAQEVGAQRVAVGQHKNDQGETMIMRFLRGTGIDGLAAMDYVRSDGVIRPLLGFSRSQVEAYCQERHLDPRHDLSNQETVYTRNRVRNELIPYIEKHFNPNIVQRLFDMSIQFRQESEWMNAMVQKWMDQHVPKEAQRLVVDMPAIEACHDAMINRIVREILRQDKGLKNVSGDQVAGVVGLIRRKPHGAMRTIGMTEFEVNYDTLIIRKGRNKERVVGVKDGCLTIEQLSTQQKRRTDTDHVIYVDAAAVQGDLRVRTRKNGDKFQPFGMKGRKKLKDFFVDNKVPRDLRDHVPLVCDDQGILWVVGHRKSERTRITDDTTQVLLLRWSSCSPD